MRTAALAVLALLSSACAGHRASSSEAAPDRALGLSKASVFDAPAPPEVKPRDWEPGENPLLARWYPGAPPLIPHGVASQLPITRRDNACLDCHAITGPKQDGVPTPVPASHYTDLRRSPSAPGAEVVGARYVCISCHVSPSHAEPLVGNRFAR